MGQFYAILLMAFFYFLLVIEFFVPSGGLIGVAAGGTLIAAIVVAFSHSVGTGLTVLAVALVTTPLVFLGMVRMWPHTPIGKRMLNRRPGESHAVPNSTTPSGTPLQELVGCFGVAKTDLLPSGTVVLKGQKLDAVSTGLPIDQGTQVVVSHVEAGKIHVRAAQDSELLSQSDSSQSPSALEKPLESFDFE